MRPGVARDMRLHSSDTITRVVHMNPAVGFSNLRRAFQIPSSHSWRILASLRTTVRVDTFNSFAMSSLV